MSILEAADAPFRINAPIEHIQELPDGTLLAHVVVTSETPDSQGEVVDYDGFKAAAPGLMKWAVLGQMHDPERNDAGTILRLYLDDENRRAEADVHVVDPVAVRKVLSRVYKMVSLGGTKLALRADVVAGRPVRRIVKMLAEELSLVPIGANADAMIRKQYVLAKMGTDPETLSDEDRHALIDAQREALEKAEMSGAAVNDLPDSDFAYIEPGGSKDDAGKTVPRSLRHFPIHDEAHVRNALARLSSSPFGSKARAKVEAAARRMGIGEPAEEAGTKRARKEARKMAKAERKAAESAEPVPDTTEEPLVKAAPADGDGGDGDAKDGDGDGGKAPFPGAKKPFGGKGKKARKARKMAKAADSAARVERFAKGKNKTIKMLAEALEAVTCAISEEADEGEADAVKALQGIADGIHEQMMIEAAEVHPDDDDEMEPMLDPDDEDADEAPMAYAKARRRAANRAPRLAKRLAKSRRAVRALRKSRASLRKERRQLRKAALFTSVLTKSGARNSAADMAKIDAIHAATVDLGTTSHKAAEPEPAPGETATADPMTKASTSIADQMREALASVIPADKLTALEARLVALDEKSSAQGETLAKIARSPSDGGPERYRALLRGGPEPETDGETRGDLLAKAATLIDDPRLREQVSSAAALDLIQRQRTG